MTNKTEFLSLRAFADRVALGVSELNGLISSMVNEEVTVADFGDDLTELFDKLDQVEAAVSELAKLFWR